MLIILALLHSLQHPHFWRATATVENERESERANACARERENGYRNRMGIIGCCLSLLMGFLFARCFCYCFSRKWAHPGPEREHARARERDHRFLLRPRPPRKHQPLNNPRPLQDCSHQERAQERAALAAAAVTAEEEAHHDVCTVLPDGSAILCPGRRRRRTKNGRSDP
jgi:hypothetical protein